MRRILVATWVLWSLPAFATTYYVNKSGSNANSCATAQSSTPANGKLTIAAGIGCLSSGDTLVVGNGTYAEAIDNTIPSGINDSSHTTLTAQTVRGVTITGCTGGSDHPNNNVVIFAKNYITLDGFEITNTSCGGIGSPVYIGSTINDPSSTGSSYILVTRGTYRDSTRFTCIAFRGGDYHLNSHITYTFNVVYNCGTDSTNGTIDGFDGHCIYQTSHDSTFTDNIIHDCGMGTGGTFALPGWGIHQFGGDPGIFGCDSKDNNLYARNTIYSATGEGLLMSCGSGNVAYDNVIYNSGTNGNRSGFRVGNLCANCTIFNNTMYSNADCLSINAGASNPVIRNNICWANTSNDMTNEGASGVTQDHNLCSSGCASSSDPQFVNASLGNFHLSVDDNGGSSTGAPSTDFDGVALANPPDRGAFQFVPASSTPTIPVGKGKQRSRIRRR